jgi:phage terminase large subunit-like protein
MKPVKPKKRASLLLELLSYCDDVISGKVAACQKHKWACMRFQRDIVHQETDEFPFVFVEKNAERFFAWMNLFKHRKGILKGQQIKPHIIQKFVFGNIYGWYNKDTNLRRFSKFYWQVARKNAKSQSLAIVSSYELMVFLGGETSEVYCAATKTEQAKIVFDETVAMLNGCQPLKNKYKVAYGRITHLLSGSVMRPLSEEDRKTGDGLNVQFGCVDEYHAHEDSLIYDIIDSGMGARSQPLLGIITTAGFDLNNPCRRIEYDLVSKILNPDSGIFLEHYFAMVNELDSNNTSEDVLVDGRKITPGELIDDINDEPSWKKANPIICSYPEGRDYLRKKLKEALEAPEKMRNFLTKHMDVWVNQREFAYMDMAKWKACAGIFPDLTGAAVHIGGDLSTKDDLTSVGYEFVTDDKCYIRQHSYIPLATLEEKIKNNNKIPWQLWVDQGYITVTEGAAVDYKFVKDDIKKQIEKNKWDVKAFGFDPWNASQMLSDLIEDYGEEKVIEIRQGVITLSEPTKDFRVRVKDRKIVHENDPLLNFAVLNAVVRSDNNGNIKLDKEKSKEKIDPLTALINAHVRSMIKSAPSAGGRVFFV